MSLRMTYWLHIILYHRKYKIDILPLLLLMSAVFNTNIHFYDFIVYITNDNITSEASTQFVTTHSVTQYIYEVEWERYIYIYYIYTIKYTDIV